MISIVITAFKEPGIARAIESIIQQDIKEEYELIVSAPDLPTINIARKYKKVKIFQDPGQGKSTALNLLLPKLKGRIIILTDGDVCLGKNSINSLLEKFQDKTAGVSGHPIPSNSRENLFGYWSHVLCYSAHKLRQARNQKNQFLECSGYLWAFRNDIIKKFPKDVAEDTIVPILFWLKGWKIAYSQDSLVYVKYPDNLKDFLEQKKRTAKSHETLDKYTSKIPRMKTFSNEALGSLLVLNYAKNFQEFIYSLALFPFRLYIWFLAFYHKYVKQDFYQDGWKRVESAR